MTGDPSRDIIPRVGARSIIVVPFTGRVAPSFGPPRSSLVHRPAIACACAGSRRRIQACQVLIGKAAVRDGRSTEPLRHPHAERRADQP